MVILPPTVYAAFQRETGEGEENRYVNTLILFL